MLIVEEFPRLKGTLNEKQKNHFAFSQSIKTELACN